MKDKKINLKSNCLNVIPLPSRKSVSPKNMSYHLPFDKSLLDPKKEYIFSPKITNRVISFEKFRSKEETKKIESKDKENIKDKEKDKEKEKVKDIEKEKENEKKNNKVIKKDKEKINKNILTPKKIDIKETKRNSVGSNKNNNTNSGRASSKTKKQEFLYIPHIVLDPLDVLKNQIEIILSQYDEKLKNLNDKNIENCTQYLIKKAHTEYTNKLLDIYDKKEKELIKIKNKYSPELYKVSLNNNEEEEEDEENKKKYDELIQKREKDIMEIEKKYNEKKIDLKNGFKKKMEDIKKLYDEEKQKILNKELVNEIKKKLIKIFNDKKMMNKKGINFSLRDYKNSIKNSNIKTDKLRDTTFLKK